MKEPTHGNMTSMHFYGWKRGLKTGMYYLRSRPAVNAIQFTVDQGLLLKEEEAALDKPAIEVIKTSLPKVSNSGSRVGGLVGVGKVVIEERVQTEEGVQTEEEGEVIRQKLKEQAILMCSLENKEGCEMCSG